MSFNKALFGFIRIAFSVMLLMLIVFATTELGKTAYDFGYRVFTEPAMAREPGRDILVQVREDMSAKELGEMLEQKGLVDDGRLFFIQLKLSVYSKKINPGIYTLNTSMTAKDMMAAMSAVEETETTEQK